MPNIPLSNKNKWYSSAQILVLEKFVFADVFAYVILSENKNLTIIHFIHISSGWGLSTSNRDPSYSNLT